MSLSALLDYNIIWQSLFAGRMGITVLYKNTCIHTRKFHVYIYIFVYHMTFISLQSKVWDPSHGQNNQKGNTQKKKKKIKNPYFSHILSFLSNQRRKKRKEKGGQIIHLEYQEKGRMKHLSSTPPSPIPPLLGLLLGNKFQILPSSPLCLYYWEGCNCNCFYQ